MKNEPKIALPGSNKTAAAGYQSATLNKDEKIEITIRLRRKRPLEIDEGSTMTHEQYEQQHGASADDAKLVQAFLKEHHLQLVEFSSARRSMMVRGSIANMEAAFNVNLTGMEQEGGSNFRARSGEIFIPGSLKDIITGVFGLDNRPVARPMFRAAEAAPTHSFTPDQLSKIYGFPAGVNGHGQTIGIIELGGGFKKKDITSYFRSLKIKAPAVKAVLVDKAKNSPTNANSADGEVMLDIEVAGAVAPGAKIAVYFTPNTDKGFLDAITKSVHDTVNKPAVISISWGSAEVNWTSQALTNMNEAFKAAAALGVTITVAAGDSGSSDSVNDGKVHVDFPASSPYVLACGGTRLEVAANGALTETVWHDSSTSATGGGVSDVFPLPDYQLAANVPLALSSRFKGRGVPDVAGDADPDTGYKVLVDGEQLVIGGTSAVAPLMAGFIALINQQRAKPAGYINPVIYGDTGLCRDIVSGDNITTTTNLGYKAGPGWDACTGLGVLSKFTS